MAVIEVQSVWKSFRIYEQRALTLKEVLLVRRSRFETFWALRDVGFDVSEGEMLGLIGPNGSGKSTMLKTIARILTPNHGSVEVTGKISAMLELGTGFHPELSGHDNIYLAGSIMGLTNREVAKRYDDIVDFAGIGDFIETPVKNYSSGMYARLAFAVAINVSADVLLIDEVLSVGDEAFQRKCHDRIHQLRKDGTTIVFVSHSLNVVRNLCQNAIWLEHGEVRKQGPASEVVAQYYDDVSGADVQAGRWVSPAAGERVGTGEVRVTNTRLLDSSGREVRAVQAGAACTVSLEYEAAQSLPEVAVTLELRRPDGFLLGCVDSAGSSGAFSLQKGGGRFDYGIPALPLVPGEYEVTLGLHDKGKRQIYDWLERTQRIVVGGGAGTEGALYLPGEWKLTEGPS